jgi:hypothetical protein
MNAPKIRLYGSTTTGAIETPVLSILFGEMVKRALPVVEHYHSDLFHDAEWLRENVTGPTWFFWVVRQCGTDIGQLATLRVQNPSLRSRGDVLYRVTVERDDHNVWSATFEPTMLEDVR